MQSYASEIITLRVQLRNTLGLKIVDAYKIHQNQGFSTQLFLPETDALFLSFTQVMALENLIKLLTDFKFSFWLFVTTASLWPMQEHF